jgi:hypothetical protein
MAQYSSGTYTYVVINNTTGGTACNSCTSTLQPHPTYGGGTISGDTVIQLNAVTIGGFNGLNS